MKKNRGRKSCDTAPLTKVVKNYSIMSFLESKKTKKDCSKVKKHGAGPNLFTFFKNKVPITTNFLALFLSFFLLQFFPSGF